MIATLVFILQLLGTDRFADIDTVQRALARAPEIVSLQIVRETQGLVELRGVSEASREQLVAEVSAVAEDRFSIESQRDEQGVTIFVLRKISLSSP
ncbi:MAG: hypothetical protein HY465_03640 [Deltaproteobacteria bacterium]|nr:hypothetical protein [Deltaproteobacteria bacterium]